MKKSLEYITALSTDEIVKMMTINKSRYSKEELAVASDEAKARGINVSSKSKNGYYDIEEKTTGQYMMEELGDGVVVPTNNDSNPIALRHLMTTDMDCTTFLMWLVAFAPLFAGAIVSSGFADSIGIGFINKFMLMCIFDAIFGLADVYLLHRHGYRVKSLIFWAVWIPPVYMKKRMKLLREKNMQHIVWIISFVILLII